MAKDPLKMDWVDQTDKTSLGQEKETKGEETLLCSLQMWKEDTDSVNVYRGGVWKLYVFPVTRKVARNLL